MKQMLDNHLSCVNKLRQEVAQPYDSEYHGDDINAYNLGMKYYKLMIMSSDCAVKGNVKMLKLLEVKIKAHVQECMEDLEEQAEKGLISEHAYLTWCNVYKHSFNMFE